MIHFKLHILFKLNRSQPFFSGFQRLYELTLFYHLKESDVFVQQIWATHTELSAPIIYVSCPSNNLLGKENFKHFMMSGISTTKTTSLPLHPTLTAPPTGSGPW